MRINKYITKKLQSASEKVAIEKYKEMKYADAIDSFKAALEGIPFEDEFQILKDNVKMKPTKEQYHQLKKIIENSYFIKMTELNRQKEK